MTLGDFRRMETKQTGQHLAHNARDVIAIAIEVPESLQTVALISQLKLCHALSHGADAMLQCFALTRREATGDLDHPTSVTDQFLFGWRCLLRERGAQLPTEQPGIVSAV